MGNGHTKAEVSLLTGSDLYDGSGRDVLGETARFWAPSLVINCSVDGLDSFFSIDTGGWCILPAMCQLQVQQGSPDPE